MNESDSWGTPTIPILNQDVLQVISKISDTLMEENPDVKLHTAVYKSCIAVLFDDKIKPRGCDTIDILFLYYMPVYRQKFITLNPTEESERNALNHAACSLILNYLENINSNISRRLCMAAVRHLPDVFSELMVGPQGGEMSEAIEVLRYCSTIAGSIKYYTKPARLAQNIPYLLWLYDFMLEAMNNPDGKKFISNQTMKDVIIQITIKEKIIKV